MKFLIMSLFICLSISSFAQSDRAKREMKIKADNVFAEKEKPEVKKQCDEEIKEHCSGSKSVKECLQSKLGSFSKGCQAVVMKRVVAMDMQNHMSGYKDKHEKCNKEVEKVCGDSGMGPECMKKNGYKFSKTCKGFVSFNSKMMQTGQKVLTSCAKDLEKLCSSSGLGGRDQFKCFQKNFKKLKSGCRKMLNASKSSAKDMAEEASKIFEKEK